MTAEELGRKLLAEVEECQLDQVRTVCLIVLSAKRSGHSSKGRVELWNIKITTCLIHAESCLTIVANPNINSVRSSTVSRLSCIISSTMTVNNAPMHRQHPAQKVPLMPQIADSIQSWGFLNWTLCFYLTERQTTLLNRKDRSWGMNMSKSKSSNLL